MRAGIQFVLLLSAIASLIGCGDRFSLWESAATGDQTFILNKVSGDLYAIQDGALRPVPRDASRPWSGGSEAEIGARANSLAKSRWIADDIIQVSVATKYRGGHVQVKGMVTPCIEGVRPAYGGRVFGLEFQDAEAFRVLEIEVDAADLVSTQGLEGKCDLLSFDKRADIGAEDWQEAVGLNVTWNRTADGAAAKWAKENPKDAAERKRQAEAEQLAELNKFLEQMKGPAVEKADDSDDRAVSYGKESEFPPDTKGSPMSAESAEVP